MNHQSKKSQNNLGISYKYGDAVEKNLNKAIEYFKLAADQGYDVAQNNLGVAYEYGSGVKKDLKQAVKYYQLSADQEFDEAQNI